MGGILSALTSPGMLITYGIVVFCIIVTVLMRKWYTGFVKRHANDEYKSKSMRFASTAFVLVRYGILIVAFIAILQVNGVEIGGMIAALGVVGIVVGFALQSTLEDVIMGIHILTDRYFVVGDVIDFNGTEGRVMEMTPQTTKIRILKNRNVMSISNRLMDHVTVIGKQNDIEFLVSYEEDPAKLEEVLTESAKKIEGIGCVREAVYKGINGFNEGGMVILVRLWCPAINKLDTLRDSRRIIIDDLRAAGIRVLPQQVMLYTPSDNGSTGSFD